MNPNPEQLDAPFTTGEIVVHISERSVQVGLLTDGPFPFIHAILAKYELDKPACYCHAGKHNGSRQRLSHQEREKVLANANLIAKAFNAATALHAAGWDAARVFERLPEVMRVLDHNCTGFAAQLKRDTAGGGR